MTKDTAAPPIDLPSSKKPRLDSSACLTDVINPELLTEESKKSLRQQYESSLPYTHAVLHNAFHPAVLVKVRDEIINNIQATYKETDLFKVFQTGDLGNLPMLDKESTALLPNLMLMQKKLYSDEFRSFVRNITGCGELSDKIDCSCNVYAQGGHLLCHDDVIGTRRVSYIIYLTDPDPDEKWTEADGGALELYPLLPLSPEDENKKAQGENVLPQPDPTPSAALLPLFNTMAMFTVLPGKSFHSVQEVFAKDKPRMSISGWYHAPSEPEDADHASLKQLQAKGGGDGGGLRAGQDQEGLIYSPFSDKSADEEEEPAEAEEGLSDADVSLLLKWINPTYLSEETWALVQKRFEADGSIQLQSFLKKNIAEKIKSRLVEEDKVDGLGNGLIPSYSAGLDRNGKPSGWSVIGPPHKQRYLHYEGPASKSLLASSAKSKAANAMGKEEESSSGVGGMLAQVQAELFSSGAFGRLLGKFTSLKMVSQRSEVRRFRPGLDYTVAHYGILTKDPRLDVVLCFVEDSLPSSLTDSEARDDGGASSSAPAPAPAKEGSGKEDVEAGAWDLGEVGGFEAYLLAEEEDEKGGAADTYRQGDDESGVLNVSAASNSLNLVLRDEGLIRFIKFVSFLAPSSRWDLAMECVPEDDEE